MKGDIEYILDTLLTGVIKKEEAVKRLLNLHSVSECQHNYVVFNGCFKRCTKCNKVINENHPDFR